MRWALHQVPRYAIQANFQSLMDKKKKKVFKVQTNSLISGIMALKEARAP